MVAALFVSSVSIMLSMLLAAELGAATDDDDVHAAMSDMYLLLLQLCCHCSYTHTYMSSAMLCGPATAAVC